MSAFWRILLPIRISLQDNDAMLKRFDNLYAEDFVFDKVHTYQIEAPTKRADGTPFVFERTEKIYHLDSTLLKQELQPFFVAFVKQFQRYANEQKYEIYSALKDEPGLDLFLEQFTSYQFDGDVDKFMAYLGDGEQENYFVHDDSLPHYAAYQGYPFSTKYNSSIQVISLLYSYEKMGVFPEETVMFHNFTEYIKKNLRDRFKLAQYIFVAGY